MSTQTLKQILLDYVIDIETMKPAEAIAKADEALKQHYGVKVTKPRRLTRKDGDARV